MSREIKFRAWDNAFEQMVEWDELKFDKDPGDKYICFYEQEDGSESIWNGGADYTVLQYTGLEDKNDREVYDRDICNFYGRFGIEKGVIKFLRHGFHIVLESGAAFKIDEFYLEVIGNIYENPELLEDA